MSHQIVQCSCGAVISQCRCFSADKPVKIVRRGCVDCLKEQTSTEKQVDCLADMITDLQIDSIKYVADSLKYAKTIGVIDKVIAAVDERKSYDGNRIVIFIPQDELDALNHLGGSRYSDVCTLDELRVLVDAVKNQNKP